MVSRTENREHAASTTGQQLEKVSPAFVSGESLQQYGSHFVAEPAKDIFAMLGDYARQRPDVAAVWCLGLGFLLGWKLRG